MFRVVLPGTLTARRPSTPRLEPLLQTKGSVNSTEGPLLRFGEGGPDIHAHGGEGMDGLGEAADARCRFEGMNPEPHLRMQLLAALSSGLIFLSPTDCSCGVK